ncbi:anthranilate synthase component I family protein [Falsibacillus albus]|uniref:Anthranilate synthase component I family protein n=1 Tax=Falsibacillus albus TaxID=2478915 RepID=A0A3L7JLG6_9BACI|nr:anthranilate synthase component I family protein [Falsibacillus albus]RLQ91668.1 anthranilate synthase component I family protein [Falsibacillus albus]
MQKKKLIYEKSSCSYQHFFNKYEELSSGSSYHVLLESGRGGRYSFAGLNPFAKLVAAENGLEVETEGTKQFINGDPLLLLYDWLEQHQTHKHQGIPDFQGGLIGFISYDYVRYIENLPSIAEDDLSIPDLYFLAFDEWVAFDHLENEIWAMKLIEDENEEKAGAAALLQRWKENGKQISVANTGFDEKMDDGASVSMTEQMFMEAVEAIREYIASGDVFQVNLSVRQSKLLSVQPFQVYKQLRALNPSPYMSFIHTPDFEIVSGSPELLVKKSGMDLSTRPIAGTRSRGKNHEEDLQLASELIHNEKERAEHVMLVDLERNDLGKVCRYGTVHVDEFMVIEKYSHVMHIVSNVRGELAEDCGGADVIRAVFPGGTITGAPKIRTMEIIEELEPVKRGLYTGSIGWIGFNGDLELNIVIRTMLAQSGLAHIQAGAGIVIDSNPKHEYKESLKKAAALWKAIELAEAEGDRHDLND